MVGGAANTLKKNLYVLSEAVDTPCAAEPQLGTDPTTMATRAGSLWADHALPPGTVPGATCQNTFLDKTLMAIPPARVRHCAHRTDACGRRRSMKPIQASTLRPPHRRTPPEMDYRVGLPASVVRDPLSLDLFCPYPFSLTAPRSRARRDRAATYSQPPPYGNPISGPRATHHGSGRSRAP